jgi:hypothetical protein
MGFNLYPTFEFVFNFSGAWADEYQYRGPQAMLSKQTLA